MSKNPGERHCVKKKQERVYVIMYKNNISWLERRKTKDLLGEQEASQLKRPVHTLLKDAIYQKQGVLKL